MVTVWGTEWLCPPPRARALPPAAARVLRPEPAASESETLGLGPRSWMHLCASHGLSPSETRHSKCLGLDGPQAWF